MKLAAPRPKTGVLCSACGATVVVSPTLRWTKMQCPKCRAVTALPNPRPEGPIPEEAPQGGLAGKEPPERLEATQFEARLSTLETRLASLEQELTSLRAPQDTEAERDRRAKTGAEISSRDRGIHEATGTNGKERQPEDRPPGVLHWEAIMMAQADKTVCDQVKQEILPSKASERFSQIANRLRMSEESDWTPGNSSASAAAAQALEDEPLKEASEDRMVEKLAEIKAGKVAIRVKEGNTEAILFGEWLGLVFIKAGWTVTAFEARPLPPEEQNLTLAIGGNFPFPKRASTIHCALAAAGLGLVFGIDPMSDSPIPTLIVPRRPMEESDQAEADAQEDSPKMVLAADSPEDGSEPVGS